ncbi:aa3-type cytochrome c oxidase subunit IV [Aestuariivirga sp.]|uniref:aa3-type cytochrome c oxidase subunit IV n=1 Tax=Aestuariivirga sp. TaxID=2650926 RepID=UPI0039E5FC33
MADHGGSGSYSGDIQSHEATYEGFIKGSISVAIMCGFVLVALCSFAFGHAWAVFLGFAGLIVGAAALVVEAKASGKFYASVALLVLFGLITAINVS